eukprot:GHVU01231182.1.p1 GENE.GHVU01231182.1~~GHVU01231182.1.p1  ORF type:complete len:312 (+),score=60.49 GHVU01231182.1:74-937(+)
MVKQKKKERKWNKRVDSADIVEALAIQKSKDAIAAKKGDSLFVIDTVGKESRRIKKLIKKDYNATKAGVNHKLSKHHISKLKALEPKVGNAGGAKGKKRKGGGGAAATDIWGTNVSGAASSPPPDGPPDPLTAAFGKKVVAPFPGHRRVGLRNKAPPAPLADCKAPGVRLPHGGQSYNPDPVAYQAALNLAVAPCLRQERDERRLQAQELPMTSRLCKLFPEADVKKLDDRDKQLVHGYVTMVDAECATGGEGGGERRWRRSSAGPLPLLLLLRAIHGPVGTAVANR